MPGRVMDHDGAHGSVELSKERSEVHDGATHNGGVERPAPPVQQSNGDVAHISNGVASESLVGRAPGDTLDEPAQLDQSWRNGEGFPSLGKLLARQSQHCYQALGRCVAAMASMPLEAQQQQANGIVPHSGPDTSKQSLEKKRLLLNFAKEQREFFIKSLVLIDWCRKADEIYKLKDVYEWQKRQSDAQTTAADAFLRLQNNMIAAKMPNPNIEGAMEIMSTSKASWIPDLGYLPPKRLSAKQLLETLRNMNVILSTRLILHEDLPQQLQDYSIADGRATFKVPGEFEIDLSIADEDPSTPFYFIDIRFLYQPSTSGLDDRFRGQAEWRVNQILATKGLKGAYDFLHNYVLTHKINILRSQAADMVRGKWFDCLRSEMLRRNLVVTYWTGSPGKQSWLEFGVYSGRDERTPLGDASPRIGVRWFRSGVHVPEANFDFDWDTLDLESCVMAAIAKHTAWLLDDLQQAIQGLAPAKEASNLASQLAGDEPEELALSLSLPTLRTPLTLRVESVTGQIVLSPPSTVAREAEPRLIHDSSTDRARRLASLLCALVQDQVNKEAQLLGWSTASSLVRQDNLSTHFGGKSRFSIFVPSKAWGADCALAVSFSIQGYEWWICQLADKPSDKGGAPGKVIQSTRAIQHREPTAEGRSFIGKRALLRVERQAIAEIAFISLSTDLDAMGVSHRITRLEPLQRRQHQQNLATSVATLFSFSSLVAATSSKDWKPWADDMARLTHHGIVGEHDLDSPAAATATIRHDLRLTLAPGKFRNLQKHLEHSRDPDIALNSSGGLALKLHTTFGQSLARHMQSRLRDLEQLDRNIGLLRKQKLECEHASPTRLLIVYSQSPRLTAEFTFGKNGNSSVGLKLGPPGDNPHRRLRTMLEHGINRAGENGFESILRTLTITLPLLRLLDRLESLPSTGQSLAVHVRSPAFIVLKYKSPLPVCTVHIKLRARKSGSTSKAMWYLQLALSPANLAQGQQYPEELKGSLGEFNKGKSEHWFGLGSGIVADAEGIAEVVEKIDAVLRRFEGQMPAVQPIQEEAKPEETAPPAATQQAAAPPKLAAQAQQPPSGAAPQPAAPTQDRPQKAQAPGAAPKKTAANSTGPKKDVDVIMLD